MRLTPTKPGIKQTFSFQSAHYRLSATFIEQKFTIQLEDLVDWIVYLKEYTEQDIGKQIHKRVGLDLLFNVLMITEAIQINRNLQVQKAVANFGDVIHSCGTPCFKVNSGGQVTIFVCLVTKFNNQEIIYESTLHLDKKCAMDQSQILAQCSLKQIKQLRVELAQKLQILNEENAELKKHNNERKSDCLCLQQKLFLKNKQLSGKFEILKDQIGQLNLKHLKVQEEQQLFKIQLLQLAKKSQEQRQNKQKLDKMYVDLEAQKNLIKDLKEQVSRQGNSWSNQLLRLVVIFIMMLLYKIL